MLSVQSTNPPPKKKALFDLVSDFRDHVCAKGLWKVTKGIGMLRFVRTIYTCNAHMIFFETKLTARHHRHHKMEHT